MPGVPWIKLWTGIFDDEKIKIIQGQPEGDTIVLCWLRLLCLAGKCGRGGRVSVDDSIPYTNELLSQVWGLPQSTVRLATDTLAKLNMIQVADDGNLLITHWDDYQDIKSYEDMKEQGRVRQQRFREKKKSVTLLSRDVTQEELEVEEEVEERKKRGEKVSLSDKKYEILSFQYGKREVDGKIDDINNYCLSKGKTYKDYAAVIRAWFKKDGVTPKAKPKVCPNGHFYTGDTCEECI